MRPKTRWERETIIQSRWRWKGEYRPVKYAPTDLLSRKKICISIPVTVTI